MSLLDKAIKGGKWIYFRSIANKFTNLIVLAILARKLEPAEFGIVAIATFLLE